MAKILLLVDFNGKAYIECTEKNWKDQTEKFLWMSKKDVILMVEKSNGEWKGRTVKYNE